MSHRPPLPILHEHLLCVQPEWKSDAVARPGGKFGSVAQCTQRSAALKLVRRCDECGAKSCVNCVSICRDCGTAACPNCAKRQCSSCCKHVACVQCHAKAKGCLVYTAPDTADSDNSDD